jgi:glycosyltransferase involved in cell wall biosynthesis
MKSMRVVLVRNAQPYDFGGGERFPVFLGEVLKSLGIEAHIISRNPKLLEYATAKQIPVTRSWWWNNQHWSGVRVLLFPLYALWQAVLYLWYLELFRRIKPSAVHIQSKDDFIAATYAAKSVGARVVWTDHADLKHVWRNLQVPYKNPIGKWIYRAAHKADAITVVSESEYAEVIKNLPVSSIRDKVQVVYNGTSDALSSYSSILEDEEFTFCAISRLVTDKGIGEAIEAFARLQKEFPTVRLVLVGSGPEEEQFKKKASGIPNITFAGYQPDPLSFVARAHVMIQPTYHEGFSVALVEASMMKKPIIATAVGGNVEIIRDHETGLLVPPKDTQSLYTAMKSFYKDSTLREKLAANARIQYEQKFVFDTIVKERFLKLYEKTTD